MPKLLALLSNPDNEVKLRMNREIKEINSRISQKVAHDYQCKQVPAINIDELPGLLIREKPELLHFSGHGDKSQLSFEDKLGKSKNVSSRALEMIFKETGHYVMCMVINACGSSKLAEKLSLYIPHVIGFPGKIEDELSETFSKTFYETLSLGHSISSCFELAKGTIMSDIPGSSRLPILYENKKLPNFDKTVFREPSLITSFELNDVKVPKITNGMYVFWINVTNIPLNTSYIIYEFIDDTIKDSQRFYVVKDLSSGTYCDGCLLYGNIIIRAWLWFGESNYGIGIQSSLEESLLRNYKGNLPPTCKKAFEHIQNH
jgi:hypothetical protein